jgi:hypothetical protein
MEKTSSKTKISDIKKSNAEIHDGRLLYMQFAPGVKLRLLLVSGLLAAILCVVKIPHL